MSEYRLGESLGFIIGLAGRAISNGVQRNFREHDCNVTAEHWTVLVRLWDQEGLTQNELAERTGKDEPSMSRLIQNMLNRELIYRQTDPVDARRKRIYLTEQGKELQKELMALVQQTYEEATIGITEEELAITKRTLKKITANL